MTTGPQSAATRWTAALPPPASALHPLGAARGPALTWPVRCVPAAEADVAISLHLCGKTSLDWTMHHSKRQCTNTIFQLVDSHVKACNLLVCKAS